MNPSNNPAKPVVVIHSKRPRCAAYQVMRYLDGAPLVLTCSRRGMMRLFAIKQVHVEGNVFEERLDRLDGEDASDALNRAVACGYDLVRISDEVRARAGAPKRHRFAAKFG